MESPSTSKRRPADARSLLQHLNTMTETKVETKRSLTIELTHLSNELDFGKDDERPDARIINLQHYLCSFISTVELDIELEKNLAVKLREVLHQWHGVLHAHSAGEWRRKESARSISLLEYLILQQCTVEATIATKEKLSSELRAISDDLDGVMALQQSLLSRVTTLERKFTAELQEFSEDLNRARMADSASGQDGCIDAILLSLFWYLISQQRLIIDLETNLARDLGWGTERALLCLLSDNSSRV